MRVFPFRLHWTSPPSTLSRQKIGNYRIEPPGLFRGRGEHPKQGLLKTRVRPEDIVINCSEDAEVRRACLLACWDLPHFCMRREVSLVCVCVCVCLGGGGLVCVRMACLRVA